MAKPLRGVVQVERLSEQVYLILRDDLRTGEFAPGERLVEAELAVKYGVSRTPVREAIFQLTREGLLHAVERGYAAPVYTRKDMIERLEVKRLLDPKVAEHVAADATSSQAKALAKIYEQEVAAHAAGRVKAFIRANLELRALYTSICSNELLAKCLRLVDDQFEGARSVIHQIPANRERSLEHEARLLEAIAARKPKDAADEANRFLDYLEVFVRETDPARFI